MTPIRFEDGSPMLLAGLRRGHAFEEAGSGIAEQWREFLSGQEIPGRVGSFFYGVMCGADATGLEYMCGVGVNSFDALAAGTGRMRVPAQHYAVFRHPKGAPLASTWRQIFAWLDEGPFASANRPDFERYSSAPELTSDLEDVEIWIGVVEKGAGHSASA